MTAKFITVVCASLGGWKAGHQLGRVKGGSFWNGWQMSEIVKDGQESALEGR